MTNNSVCLTPYLRNYTSCDCDFWYTCKMMISPAIFVISQNFDFCSFLRGKKKKKISVCFALYLRSCRTYHQDFDSDIYRCFYLFFKKRCNMVNVKIILLEPRPCPEGSNKIGSVHRSVRPSVCP